MPLILSILASPRPDGTVATLLETAEKSLAQEGATIEHIDITGLTVTPCKGCMSCRKTNVCTLPDDDAHRIAKLLDRADAVIVAAPTYWGGMPGQLKTLFDRMVYALIDTSSGLRPRPLHRGKRAMIITACTTPWPWNILARQSSGTISAIRAVLKPAGFRITAHITAHGTAKGGIPARAMTHSATAARRLICRIAK